MQKGRNENSFFLQLIFFACARAICIYVHTRLINRNRIERKLSSVILSCCYTAAAAASSLAVCLRLHYNTVAGAAFLKQLLGPVKSQKRPEKRGIFGV